MGRGEEGTCWAGGGHPVSHEGDAGGVVGVGPDTGHKAHLDDGDRQMSP